MTSPRRRVTARRERVRQHTTPRWAAHTVREKQTRQATGKEHTKACGCHVAQLQHKPGPSRMGGTSQAHLGLGTATKSRLALPKKKNRYSHTKLAHQPGRQEGRRATIGLF